MQHVVFRGNVIKKMPGYFPLSRRLILSLVVLGSVFCCSPRANAAESVVLKYSVLKEKVSVPELRTFADTGKLSVKLRIYLTLAQRKPEELRRALTQEVPANSILLDRVLDSFVGDVMLDRVSDIVHTPDDRDNQESLRSALVSSAESDGRITLIETLENYPASEVHIEGDRLTEFAQSILRVFKGLPNIRL